MLGFVMAALTNRRVAKWGSPQFWVIEPRFNARTNPNQNPTATPKAALPRKPPFATPDNPAFKIYNLRTQVQVDL